ncbi:MAG: hypothetical protein K2J12_10880 [Muribaculaceae bacterium]|nr:hypothetical protein [Muribaculaceae bacterium]
MIQIATNKEQSARLVVCGVNEATADMVDTIWENDGEKLTQLSIMSESAYEMSCLNPIPAWSLSALLSLLPKDLMWQGLYYRLVMGPNGNEWEIEYNDLSVTNNLHMVIADTPIEACVQMIEWLTANNHKLNNND